MDYSEFRRGRDKKKRKRRSDKGKKRKIQRIAEEKINRVRSLFDYEEPERGPVRRALSYAARNPIKAGIATATGVGAGIVSLNKLAKGIKTTLNNVDMMDDLGRAYKHARGKGQGIRGIAEAFSKKSWKTDPPTAETTVTTTVTKQAGKPDRTVTRTTNRQYGSPKTRKYAMSDTFLSDFSLADFKRGRGKDKRKRKRRQKKSKLLKGKSDLQKQDDIDTTINRNLKRAQTFRARVNPFIYGVREARGLLHMAGRV